MTYTLEDFQRTLRSPGGKATAMYPHWLTAGCPTCGCQTWQVTCDCWAYCDNCHRGVSTNYPFTAYHCILSHLGPGELIYPELKAYLDRIKENAKSEVFHEAFGSMAYGFLDFLKEGDPLYSLAWNLSHTNVGMCTRGDLQGLIELVEERLKQVASVPYPEQYGWS